MRVRWHRTACVLFVIASALAYGPGRLGGSSSAQIGVALRVVMFVVMLVAWAASRHGDRRDHAWTLLAGITARIGVAPMRVSQSHDVQRYLWDGAVFWSGLDPYRVGPLAPEVLALRAFWPTPVEHLAYTTIYPPGAIGLFGAAGALGPSAAPWVWKAIVVGASIATVCVAAKLLEARKLMPNLPLVAFSPLLLMETADGAHLDVLCALAVTAAMYLLARGRPFSAGLALGLGTVVKFTLVLVLVPLIGQLGWRAARRPIAGAVLVVALIYMAAAGAGLRPIGSLPVFFEKWRFGAPLFLIVRSWCGDERALQLAPPLLIVVLVGISIRARSRGWAALVPRALAAPLLVSPVVFPWYLAPLVPAVALCPSAFMLAWLGTVPLLNEAIDRFMVTGIWAPAAWPVALIGSAMLIGGSVDLIAFLRRTGDRRSPGREPCNEPRQSETCTDEQALLGGSPCTNTHT